jgi:MFS family permease
MGTGCTFAFIGMLCIVSDWFPNRLFAFAVGLSETIAMLGTALGTTLFAYLVMHAGWRYAMGLSSILAFIIMIVVFTSVRNKTLDHPGVVTHRKTIRQQAWCVVKDKQVLLAGVFGFASFGIINLFGALWGEPFFMHVYHLPLREATALITLLLVGVASGGPTLGWLSTSLGRRKPVMALTLVVEVFLFAILLYVPHLPIGTLFLLTYLIGFFSAGYIVCFAFAKEHAKKSLHGTTMAVVNLITMLSAPVLQSLVGWLLHTHVWGLTASLTTSFRVSLGILCVCFVLGLLAVLGMRETHGRPLHH